MRLAAAVPVCIAASGGTKIWAWDSKFWILSDSNAKLSEVTPASGSANVSNFTLHGYTVVSPANKIDLPSPVAGWSDVCGPDLSNILPSWWPLSPIMTGVAAVGLLVLLLRK